MTPTTELYCTYSRKYMTLELDEVLGSSAWYPNVMEVCARVWHTNGDNCSQADIWK